MDLVKPYAPKAQIEYVHRDEDPRDYRVSFDKIEKVLGFTVEHTVEDGIREVAELVNRGLIEDLNDPKLRN